MSLDPSEPTSPSDDPGATSNEPRLLTRRDDGDARDASLPNAPRSAFFRAPSSTAPEKLPQAHTTWRFPLRKLLIALIVVLALALVGCITSAVMLRRSMRAALPQLDGTLHVAGLSAQVTVTRDAQGVPSIQAASLDDLLFAQGYITAQDRLWQMDALRRHAAGELAEILGPSLVDHDRMQRTLQLRAAADRAAAALPADQLHQLQSYAAGVNAFIAQHGDSLPVEFHVLHYAPANWTPRDSLLVSLAMFQDLSTEFPTKLRRERLAQHLPPELLADLYPVGSWRDHPPTQPPPDLTAPREIPLIPLDRTQVELRDRDLATPADILTVANEFSSQRCDGCRSGSNNWAVSGAHSASAAPLVSNDMHLSLAAPDIWYEAGLHASGANPLDAVGFTLPGVPFVVVGRNRHVAWSFTNLGADVQDLRIEHLRGAGASTEFQRADGSWSPVQHHAEHIRVRFGHDVDLDVLTTSTTIGATTIETPIISGLFPSERRTLALAWTIYDPANVTSPLLGFNMAASGAALVASVAGFGGPSLNLVYADDAGHIGYHALGRIPIRGPADHHPRAMQPSLPQGDAPADEDGTPKGEDNIDEPPVAKPMSWHPGTPSSNAHRSELMHNPALTRGRRNARAPQHVAKEPKLSTEILPVAPANNFTIGSSISPYPIDAHDATQLWSGYIPYNELPSIIDPPGGVLATANARISADDYPYALALDWSPAYRVERIQKRLAGRTQLTPDDMLALENDVHSEFDLLVAQRLAYAVDHASPNLLAPDARRLHQAADILRDWTGEVTPNAVAPSIVTAFQNEIWPMLLLPQLAAHDHTPADSAGLRRLVALYRWENQTGALEELLQHQPARWLPPGYANWNDFLAAVTERALQQSHAPAELSSWRFGALHPVEIGHGVFSNLSLFDRLLGTATGSGLRETGGDPTTIKAISLHFGPSERFTADLANPSLTTGNITTGESGNPASEHYFDQFEPWLSGATFALPLEPARSTHTLVLEP